MADNKKQSPSQQKQGKEKKKSNGSYVSTKKK